MIKQPILKNKGRFICKTKFRENYTVEINGRTVRVLITQN